jgi:hypothetical protein
MAWDCETEPEFQKKLDWAPIVFEYLGHEVGNL